MKHSDLIKKLANTKFKESLMLSHKRRLKALLTPIPKTKPSYSWYALRTLPIFAILLIFTFLISFSQIAFSPSQTVYAEQIVDQAIIDISNLKIQDPQSQAKIQFIANILAEAKLSQELEYLGEETASDGTNIKKLRFTDPDLSQDLLIQINLNNPLLDGVDFQFADELHLPFEVVSGYVKNGKIIDKTGLTQKLLDASIKKSWVKSLIREHNQDCLNKNQKISSEQDVFIPSQDQKTLSNELLPFISSAEVLILNCHESWSYQPDGTLNQFHLSVYSFGNQQKKLQSAQEVILQAIEKLSSLNSEEAKQKVVLLNQAKNSKELRYSPWREDNGDYKKHLTFIDKNFLNSAIDLEIDPNSSLENSVQFRFYPDLNSQESRAIVKVVEGSFENNFLANQKLLIDKDLQNNPQRDLLLNLIVRPQNEEIFHNYLADKIVDPAAMELLKPLIKSSELLLDEFPSYTKNSAGKITKFTFNTYSLGAQKKYKF